MGAMKAFAMDVSYEMGQGGDLTDEVLEEAQRRLDAGTKPVENSTSDSPDEAPTE